MTRGSNNGHHFFAGSCRILLVCEKNTVGYTNNEKEIAALFRDGISEGTIAGTGVNIIAEPFRSSAGCSVHDGKNVTELFCSLFGSRDLEQKNNDFNYYLLTPDSCTGRGAIILLHGLNERNWGKYVQWGARLATGTGRPVVLFPIAYHMNRSPRSWVDRHIMMPLVTARASLLPDTRQTTFVNVALSTRLTVSPQRFMISGYQTINDLSEFIRSVSEGRHPHIPCGPVDVFAYSIGALATQVMMISDPSPLTDVSRVMLFCGGSVFSMMNGTSKLIMDSRAFDILLSFYLSWPAGAKQPGSASFTRLMNGTPEGEAFYAMTSLSRLKVVAGAPFNDTAGRLKAVTFAGDRVIPPDAVSATLQGADVEIWETEYPFTHENPFPVLTGEKADAVDRTFDRLFDFASSFLS